MVVVVKLSQKLQVLGSLGLRVPASPRPRARRRERRGGGIAEAGRRAGYRYYSYKPGLCGFLQPEPLR